MIGLLDINPKLPKLSLMKISSYYKALGETVEFAQIGKHYDKVYVCCLYSWDRSKCEEILKIYPDAIIGGTGWDLTTTLPTEIENCKPDYDLYTTEVIYNGCKGGIASTESKIEKAKTIANSGIGRTSWGCVRKCGFCVVPTKEGFLRQASEIKDIINPRSNVITLLDNNLTADPYCIEKLHEIRDRKLVVDITQGIDIRRMTPEIAKALSEVKHLRSLHYAWDLFPDGYDVINGIYTLSRYVKKYHHMCFVLCGYNTTLEQDMIRVTTLKELGVSPYIMKYNNRKDDPVLNDFARWVNGRFYKVCSFKEYEPRKKVTA